MHYTPHVGLVFLSTEFYMRQIDRGWLIRYIHANDASMFFSSMYLHIALRILSQRRKSLLNLKCSR